MKYISLHNPYTAAPSDSIFYAFSNEANNIGLKSHYRVFIPPGTMQLDLLHLGIGGSKAVARYKVPPLGEPEQTSIVESKFKLTSLEKFDCFATESLQGILYIAADAFAPIPLSEGGWLYVKTGCGVTLDYHNEFLIKVDTKIYNQWWNTYIHDQAGWDQYVENVETYIFPDDTCTVILNPDNSLHIPCLTYRNLLLFADLKYEYISDYSTSIIFKLIKFGMSTKTTTTEAPALSNDFKLHIPDILLLDKAHYWIDLEYLLHKNNTYFILKNYGVKQW